MRKVKWSIRDDGNSTWGTHYHGDYVVTVTDMDGDGTEWEVWFKADLEKAKRDRDQGKQHSFASALAKGRVDHFDDFEIGQAVAIEALDAIIRAEAAYEAERRQSPSARDGQCPK